MSITSTALDLLDRTINVSTTILVTHLTQKYEIFRSLKRITKTQTDINSHHFEKLSVKTQ